MFGATDACEFVFHLITRTATMARTNSFSSSRSRDQERNSRMRNWNENSHLSRRCICLLFRSRSRHRPIYDAVMRYPVNAKLVCSAVFLSSALPFSHFQWVRWFLVNFYSRFIQICKFCFPTHSAIVISSSLLGTHTRAHTHICCSICCLEFTLWTTTTAIFGWD